MFKAVDNGVKSCHNTPVLNDKGVFMGVIVDIRTGEFVATGDLGNLAEELNAMYEMEMDIEHLRLHVEDDAYAIYA